MKILCGLIAACVYGVVGCGDLQEQVDGEGKASIWVGDGRGHSAKGILRAASALAVEENVLIRFLESEGSRTTREVEVLSRAGFDAMPHVDLMSMQVTASGILINQETVTDAEVSERLEQLRELERLSESKAIILVGADDAVEGTRLVWLLNEMVAAKLRWIGAVAG